MARKQQKSQPLTTAQRLSSIVKSCRDIMRKDKGLNGDLDRLPMLTWIMFLKFLDDMELIREQEARRTCEAAGTLLTDLHRKTAQLPTPQDDSWQEMALGNFLKRVKQDAEILPDKEYDQVTVKLYGKDVVRRARVLGAEIRTRPQFLAKCGHLIISKIDARNGAFGIIPEELNGALVTNDFPLFEINTDIVRPRYLALILRSQDFIELCKRSSRGTTNRKRLLQELFLAERLRIPSLPLQQVVENIANNVEDLKQYLDGLSTVSEDLMDALASALVRQD